jgi:hypothetical protein
MKKRAKNGQKVKGFINLAFFDIFLTFLKNGKNG